MKRRILTLLVFIGILAAPLVGSEAGESWSRLYRRLTDIKQKYAVMQNIVPLDDRSLEPFFTTSLNDLVYGDLSQYRTNRSTYDDWEILTRTIIKEIGDIKGQSAASAVWDVAKSAERPLLKAEALIALGKMRAVEYAPEIATMLRNLNFNTRSDDEAAEIEAYGAVVALEAMKDDAGFESLFYASIGWYSDRVTDAASDAVLTVSEDPTVRLIAIMEDTTDYGDKRKALETALRTDAPDRDQAAVAVAALSEGLKYAETDLSRRRQLANLRMDAISAIIALGVSTEGAPALLDQAIDEGELDEGLIALQALGADGGDEAASVLARRLASFNERQASGLALNRDELTVVRQIIFALGESGNELGLPPLTEMSFVGYTPALIRQAEEAIAKIQGN